LEALTTTVTRDFHDPETLRAALETLLVIFMYEDHPVSVGQFRADRKSPSARIALQKLQDQFIKVCNGYSVLNFRITKTSSPFSTVWKVQISIPVYMPYNCYRTSSKRDQPYYRSVFYLQRWEFPVS
jgi:hypothetical protein